MSNRDDMGVHEGRRKALVDKLIDLGLTAAEERELHILQNMRGYLDRLDALGVEFIPFDEMLKLAKGCPDPERYEDEEEDS